jgi:hypothetical protein
MQLRPALNKAIKELSFENFESRQPDWQAVCGKLDDGFFQRAALSEDLR